jgi:hypothetical protein
MKHGTTHAHTALLAGAIAIGLGAAGLPAAPALADSAIVIDLSSGEVDTLAKLNAVLQTVPAGGVVQFTGENPHYGQGTIQVDRSMTWTGAEQAGAALTAAVTVDEDVTLTIAGPFTLGGANDASVVPTVWLLPGAAVTATDAVLRPMSRQGAHPDTVIGGAGPNTITLTRVTFVDGDGPSEPDHLVDARGAVPSTFIITDTVLPKLHDAQTRSLYMDGLSNTAILDGVTAGAPVEAETGTDLAIVGGSTISGGVTIKSVMDRAGASTRQDMSDLPPTLTLTDTTVTGPVSASGPDAQVVIARSSIHGGDASALNVKGARPAITLTDTRLESNNQTVLQVQGSRYSLDAAGTTSLAGAGDGIVLTAEDEAGSYTDDGTCHLSLQGTEVLAGGAALRVTGHLDSASAIASSTLAGSNGVVLGHSDDPWSFEKGDGDIPFAGQLGIRYSALASHTDAEVTDEPAAALAVERASHGAKVTVAHSSLQGTGSSESGRQAGLSVFVAPHPLVTALELSITTSNLAGPANAVLRAISGIHDGESGMFRSDEVALGVDKAALVLDQNYWGARRANLDTTALDSKVTPKVHGKYEDSEATPLLKGREYTYFRTLTTDGLYRCYPDGHCVPEAGVSPGDVPPDQPDVAGAVSGEDQVLAPSSLTVEPFGRAKTNKRFVVKVRATSDGASGLGGHVTVTGTGTKRVAGHATMVNGVATVSLGKLRGGAYTLTVAYSGQTGVAGSALIAGLLTVHKVKSTVKVTAPKRITKGKRAKVTIRVTAPGISKLNGRVRVRAGGVVVAKKLALVKGKAKVRLPKATKSVKLTVKFLGSAKAKAKTVTTRIRLK